MFLWRLTCRKADMPSPMGWLYKDELAVLTDCSPVGCFVVVISGTEAMDAYVHTVWVSQPHAEL